MKKRYLYFWRDIELEFAGVSGVSKNKQPKLGELRRSAKLWLFLMLFSHPKAESVSYIINRKKSGLVVRGDLLAAF